MNEESKIGQFCWSELATTNVQAAKSFYGEVFGWQFTDHKMGDMTYTMIKMNNGRECAGIWAIPQDQEKNIPPHWMNYILVEDLDQTLEKVKKKGARIIKPASAASDFGRFAVIQDPTGAHIALWQTLKK